MKGLIKYLVIILFLFVLVSCGEETEFTIENNVLTECNPYNNKDIVIPDGVTDIKSFAFYNCKKIRSVTIPDSVKTIGFAAFKGCQNLKTVEIPDSVTYIDSGAFCDCKRLTNITIPESVGYIESFVFLRCNRLNYNEYENGCYLGNENNPYYALIKVKDDTVTSFKINENTKIIAGGAFEDCANLVNVEMPNSAKSIGSRAFSNCTSLTSITIPNGVKYILEDTFWNCTNLTNVKIPSSVTKIADYAFYNCPNLRSIEIPNSVTSIGKNSFYGCTSLESITLPFVGNQLNGEYCTYLGYIFGADSHFDNLDHVPVLLKEVIITGGTTIDAFAFCDCSSITNITIPNSVTSIKRFAFYNCKSLSSITYNGTKAEWNAITKEDNWNYWTGKYTIHCTDGDLEK